MKRHRFDAISFVFGTLFVLVGLSFLIPADPWDLLFDSFDLDWVLPAIVLAAGAALLLSVLRPRARSVTDSPLTRSPEIDAERTASDPTPEEIEAASAELPEPPSV